ncbi:hypothetical protein C9407_16450, partial [Xanthomonas vasicola pv. vasculorum]
ELVELEVCIPGHGALSEEAGRRRVSQARGGPATGQRGGLSGRDDPPVARQLCGLTVIIYGIP